MLDILLIVLFCWLFYQAIRLTFRVAWGAAKVIAVILFILALPSLLGCVLVAGGLLLLAPVALVGLGVLILRACI